ncbi:MAG: redox-sensing transcriptional repressor Rex [Spirochaetales bacterium]
MINRKLASLPTIKRLPSYLHIVEAAKRDKLEYISGTVIAEELELEPIQVRKDLAVTGIVGKPRRGFPVDELLHAITSFLRWDTETPAILVGAGHLGSALLGYVEFPKHGLNIIAAFDTSEAKIGKTINETPVYHVERLEQIIADHGIEVAILTVPNRHAQEMADALASAGITAIWNFTNDKIKVPEHVVVQKEDLSSGYAVLSVKIREQHGVPSDTLAAGANGSSFGSSYSQEIGV